MAGEREAKVPKEDILWRHGEGNAWHMKKGEDDDNCFHRVDATEIPLRGKRYLEDRKKYPSKEAAFALVCCKCFKTKHQMLHSAKEIGSLKAYLEENSENEYFIVNWLVPGHYTVVNLYVRKLRRNEDKEFDKLFDMFRKGDAKFRSDRFKYIPQIIEAPSMVKTSVTALLGRLRPVLIGNKLTCHHFTGKNYIEVDVDTGSSRIVSAAAGILIKGFKSIIANTGFLIEGRHESELPERMLAVHCNTKVTLDKIAIKYDYQPPPPQQTSKSKGWFGGLFSRSSSNVEEEAKKEPNPDSNDKL
eukprot:CAMPEP_0184503238 /NCGR_PEP_ID=MMETSP0113_2-20130426/51774_1 /TAXON_ID=91329 /ORGANISM="Norrisiella sphaerica, Strain BC52" /LENGTH=301 /DNA_ID=CAMNT_0026892701 /DNA_START=150 /DNA_END=1055 /DNA_ORIENTATION=+